MLSTRRATISFFSSSVADVALKARSLYENKQEMLLYKDNRSPVRRQIESSTRRATISTSPWLQVGVERRVDGIHAIVVHGCCEWGGKR